MLDTRPYQIHAAGERQPEVHARIADLECACSELDDAVQRLQSRLEHAGVMSPQPLTTEAQASDPPDMTRLGAQLRDRVVHVRGMRRRLDEIILALEI
jgi:hypothetical protein